MTQVPVINTIDQNRVITKVLEDVTRNPTGKPMTEPTQEPIIPEPYVYTIDFHALSEFHRSIFLDDAISLYRVMVDAYLSYVTEVTFEGEDTLDGSWGLF